MYIGIDVGGTKIKGIVFSKGKILQQTKIETPKHTHEFDGAIFSIVEELLREYPKVKGIGICFPGAVDRKEGAAISMPSLPYIHNVQIKKLLAKRTKLPVLVENDGKCAAIAEYLHGAGKGKNTIIVLTLGTGIGGGIIANGKLCIGRGNGGEVGHITVELEGQKCACGRIGCWEEYSASRGIMKMARELGVRAENPRDVEDMAREGNAKAKEVYRKVGYYMGIGIGDLIKILDPEIITISGSITHAADLFSDSMNKEIERRVFFKHCDIKISRIKDAPSVGAASLFEFYENNSRAGKI